MKGVHFRSRTGITQGEVPPDGVPLGGTKAEATQRLQIGLVGLASMVLLVALANVLGSQADRAEEAAVPDAAPTTEPTAAAPQRDPLADAGIVPDIPAEPSPSPTTEANSPQQTAPSPTNAPSGQ